MPALRSGLLIGFALCAGAVSGCTTARVETTLAPSAASAGLTSGETATDGAVALASVEAGQAGEHGIVLPEEVAVLPSSYAGSTPSGPAAVAHRQLASLPSAEGIRENPARDVFPDAPEPGVPEEPAGKIVWEAEGTQRGTVDRLIAKYAAHYEVPESLVRRVVKRESNFNPAARNGPYWGLMQILHQTAQGMGYSGTANGLLDAETNLKYAVRYLRGAYLVADGNHDQAVRFYARGYYYDAKRKGMLEATGLGKDRKRRRQNAV